MPTPVFFETSVVRAHAQRYRFDGIPPHPNSKEIDDLFSKLGETFKGFTSKYVIAEAINSFTYDLSRSYKGKVDLELRDTVLSQYHSNIAEIEKKLEIDYFWQCKEVDKRNEVTRLHREVDSWYNSLDPIEMAIRSSHLARMGSRASEGLEPSDRIILSESRYIKERLSLLLLLFATLDRGFTVLGSEIRTRFGIDPRPPRDISAKSDPP